MTKVISHPTDADLLKYLDSELTESDEKLVRNHVQRCTACGSAIDLFQAGSDAVESLLMSVPVAHVQRPKRAKLVRTPGLAVIDRKPSRWYTNPSARAAVAVLGLATAALTVSPVRGWVIDFFNATQPESPVIADHTEVVNASSSPQRLETSSIAFVPTGTVFEISLNGWQKSGTLTIVPGPGTRAQGSVSNGLGGASLFVSSAGIGVSNVAETAASYRIQIPSSVQQIVVRVGDQVIHRLSQDELLPEYVIPVSPVSN